MPLNIDKTIKRYSTFIVVVLLFIEMACNMSREQTPESKRPSKFDSDTLTYLRIYEDSSNNFYLNGHLITFSDLELRVLKITNNRGLIYYSNQNPSEHLPRESKLFNVITTNNIGIKTFTDSSFSRSYY